MACNSTIEYLTQEYWRKSFGVLFVVLGILATFENAVVIVIVCKYRVLQTHSNKILASLAVSNFLTGALLAPLYATEMLISSAIDICVLDSIRRYLSAFLLGVALFTISFISYDRYLHLTRLKHYVMTRCKMYTLLSLCWFMPLLIPFLRYINDSEKTYAILVITLGSVLITMIVTSYICLLVAIHRHTKHSDNKRYRTHMENERRAGKTVVIIVVISFIVVVPLLIYFGMTLDISYGRVFLAKGYIIVMYLGLLNACVNPVIYCYRTPVLRKHTKRLFGIKGSQGADVSARYVSKNGRLTFKQKWPT